MVWIQQKLYRWRTSHSIGPLKFLSKFPARKVFEKRHFVIDTIIVDIPNDFYPLVWLDYTLGQK